MPNFECKAYRSERYVAYTDIEADTIEDAIEILEDTAHDLQYDEYTGNHDEPDFFIVIADDGGEEREHETQANLLNAFSSELLEKAEAVCSLWSTNQLAGAVRDMQEVINKINRPKTGKE